MTIKQERKGEFGVILVNEIAHDKILTFFIFQAREERDKKREAVLSAYQSSLSSIQDRVKKSVSKHHDLR